jgi:hypothetical protein
VFVAGATVGGGHHRRDCDWSNFGFWWWFVVLQIHAKEARCKKRAGAADSGYVGSVTAALQVMLMYKSSY